MENYKIGPAVTVCQPSYDTSRQMMLYVIRQMSLKVCSHQMHCGAVPVRVRRRLATQCQASGVNETQQIEQPDVELC